MAVLVTFVTFVTFVNYKDTRRNKTENYFLGLLVIMGVLLIFHGLSEHLFW